MPTDPFDGKPFKVKQTDHGATVYSIRPETTDKHENWLFEIEKKRREISFTVPIPGAAKK